MTRFPHTIPLLALLLAGCAAQSATEPAATTGAQAPAAEAAPAVSASEQLTRLFAQSDEAELERNPLAGLYRGDLRYADRFGDYLSEEYIAAERQAAARDLAQLKAIDRAALSPQEQVAYDVFQWQRESDLRQASPEISRLTAVRPIDQFSGFQARFPSFSSGEGVAPFNTVEDYENNLRRLTGFTRYLDAAQERMREGAAAGIVQPRVVIERTIEQADQLIASGVEKNPFYQPVTRFPDAVPEAERKRLSAEYARVVRQEILPAYTRFRDFLRREYLPATRSGVGLVHMPGGPGLYQALIERNTTTTMTPDAIHEMGLSEVKRIRAQMEAVKREVGFDGSLREFFEHIRTDPKFKPESREALREGYEAIGRRVEGNLPKLFATLPETRLEIRPVPELREKTAAGGSYQSGTPDGVRPGVFYFNAYDLPSRTTPGMETLYLHEGAPGHHFQISLATENESLPAFMRFGGNTAFVEGWALYAQDLGEPLGLYRDPYQRFGYLDSELFRAVRLVVDTGLHHKGWTREQAIEYMLDNTSRGKTNIVAEVERYIAIPGQALAYKIGQLKIRELRARAEQALGDRFDVREFHDQVLLTGALPLSVLEAKIDRWIASERG